MSYDEPFYTGSGGAPEFGAFDDRMSVSSADRSYYSARAPPGQNPWHMPTYTNMPEGRMQVEQAGFPAISQYMCGACPRYENPQPPPMRKTPLHARTDYAIDHYPPDHDTVKSSCRRCVSGYGGGCGCDACASTFGGMSTAAATGVIRAYPRHGTHGRDVTHEPMEAAPGTGDVESKYAPSAAMTLSPMHIDMTSFVLVFLFIILVFICISFSRAIGDIRERLEKLSQGSI